jgi:hypothetical protein
MISDRSALGIDPASTTVRLRLIAAYQMQFVLEGESLANHAVAKQAREEIARVLDRDPSNRAAMMAAAQIDDVDRISIRRAPRMAVSGHQINTPRRCSLSRAHRRRRHLRRTDTSPM